MSISVVCPQCKETLHLANELAGRTGACRHCGGIVTVPHPTAATPANLALEQASLEQVVLELARRGRHAVLSLVDPLDPEDADPNSLQTCLEDKTRTSHTVLHLNTDGLTPSETRQLVALFGELSATPPLVETAPQAKAPPQVEKTPPPQAQATSPPPPVDAPLPEGTQAGFSFKGDPLGMKLNEFKMRHERTIAGRRRRMPWCSDETPGVSISDLMCEGWQVDAGVVHARIDLPEENCSPTVAGAATDFVIYQFVDERLFQVTSFFATDDFQKVSEALQAKYGEPQSRENAPLRVQWWNNNCTIELTHGRIHPREPSIIRHFHDDLLDEASRRKPNTSTDL